MKAVFLRITLLSAWVVFFIGMNSSVMGANRYSVATGNWSSTSTWAATSGGAAGASVPVAGDVVFIQSGKNVTVTADAAAASITFTGAAATLTVNSGFTLSVTGAVILLHNVGNSTACSLTGLGTLSCASVDAGSNLSLNGSYSAIMTSTISNFNISGDVTMIAKESGSNYGQSGFRIEDGITRVSGQITSSLGSGCPGALRMNGVTTGLQTGTLALSGITPWGTLTGITIVLNGTGATVEYNGILHQTILGTTYTKLKINAGGTATLGANTTVNGTLYMTKGTLALNAKTLTYGASASLDFNGTADQTTGPEWPASFNKPVTISNSSGIVTIGTATFTGTSATTTINTGATLATGAGTFTAAGPMAINGAFQINQSGYATGAVAWTYGSASTLIYNNSTGPYGAIDNSHLYWPTTNGPFNVTVQNGGGINMGVARTVTGTFLLVAGSNAVQGTALTLNGTVQINGGNFQTAPTYGPSSTLIYNTTYGTSNEWTGGASNTVAAGSGIPANVTVQTGTLTLGGGRGVPGNVTVQSGAGLVLNATSGDLYIGGNLVNSGSTWTNNGRAVFFVLGNTQTITSSSGTQYFDYLALDKTAGSVQLASTNVTINTATGSVLQLLNTGGLDLNGRSITLNNNGGNILVNGGARSISSTLSGGKMEFNQFKTISGTGTLVIGTNITVNLNANGNVNFGSSITTINGTLSINSTSSCYVNSYAPTFGSNSYLVYNSSGSYGRGLEWSATSGAGYPHHVQISNNTIFDMGANSGTATARQCAGNLTVDAGSTFSMNVSPMTAAVTVMGNVVNNGTVTLSGSIGGDLKTQGNINDAGTFNANSRAIFFNGGNTQVIQGTGVFDISYVRINKSAGSVQLATNLTCEGPGGGNAMEIDGANSVLDLNGYTLYLGKAGVASTYNSLIATPGKIKGSATSSLSILGTEALGTINFDQTTPGTTNALQNLTINRTTSGTATLGNALVIDGTLTLTDGNLSGTLTYGTNGVLTYNGTAYSTTSDVEFPAASGPKDLNITNADAAGITLHANRTIAGNMTIATGKKFIIPADKQFTVNGTITNDATAAGFVVKSGGSLIQYSAVPATVERDISAWGSPSIDHGWHFLSSPVSVQAISPNFANVALTDNDFYCWWEPSNVWVNFKNTTNDPTWNTANASTNFNVGKGYLVEYFANSTKQFAGTLNNADVSITGLAISTGANKGWHLLGNPFTSAIKWNDGNWAMTNIAAGAKIWNEGIASYSDISANGIIPALNGFMVQVTSGTGQLTIPLDARVHDATGWYKSAESPSILLIANDLDGQTAQESLIRFDNIATVGYDSEFDSHFLSGYAPQFYSTAGSEQLSTNTLPEAGGTVQIPFSFIKNIGTRFTIQAKTISNLFGPIILNDLKTNVTQDLTVNPVYSFTSASEDNPNRFLITFSHLGLGDKKTDNSFTVSSSGSSILVIDNTGKNTGNVYVYNLMGQLVATSILNGNTPCKLNVNVPVGYYLVKVISSEQAYSTKIFINQR